MKKLCLFIFSLLLIFAAGCELDTSEIDRETELEYITVDTSEGKTLYHIGEPFDKSGFRIIGHYSNGKEKEEDINLVNFPDVDTKEVNPELYVTVTYEDKPYSFPIEVRQVLPSSITIKRKPKKIFYKPDEAIDLTGILAVINYTNGDESAPIDENELICTQTAQKSENDIQTRLLITVCHKDDETLTGQFNIYVQDNTVDGLDINYNSNELIRKTYMKGQDIDLKGINLLVKYGVQNTLIRDKDIIDCYREPFSITDLEEGEHDIVFYVNECPTTYKITIVDGYTVGAELETGNNIFYDGDEINFKGSDLIFKEKFSSGKTMQRDDDSFYASLQYTYNSSDKKSIREPLRISGSGLQTIHFYYEFEASDPLFPSPYEWTYDISVRDSKLNGISAIFKPNKGVNVPLEKEPSLDFEKNYGTWVINGILLNGKDDITISPESCKYEFLESESNGFKKKIKVTYHDIRQNKDFSGEAEITYVDPIITKVTLDSFPNKRSYFVGEDFNLDGLKATLYYSDGTSKTVSDGYFTTEDENAVKYCSLTNNTITEETEEVNLFFTDVNDITNANAIYVTIPIEILGVKIDYIEISPKDNYKSNLKFRKGEQYDFLKFFEVKSVSNKGDSTPIQNAEDLTFNLVSNFNTATLYVVYTTTEGKTFSDSYSKEITVLEPQPTKITMTPGNNCDTFWEYKDRSSYTVYYQDGTKEERNLTQMNSKGFDFTQDFPASTELTISYNKNETDILNKNINYSTKINVGDLFNCVTSITIEPEESAKTYLRGVEIPIKSDFKVTANYSKGFSKVLSDGDYKLTNIYSTDTEVFKDSTMEVEATYGKISGKCEVGIHKKFTTVKVYGNYDTQPSDSFNITRVGNETDDTVFQRFKNNHKYVISAKRANSTLDSDTDSLKYNELFNYGIKDSYSKIQNSSNQYTLSFSYGDTILETITITIN